MKCRNEVFMSNIGINKIDKQQEVHFDVQRDLPDCKKINASKYILTDATNPTFNRYKVPANQFECLRAGCVNSGTLFNEGAKTDYHFAGDATEFSAGVITFYALAPAGTVVTVKISNADTFADAWQYDIAVDDMNKGADDYYAIVVDLAKVPTIIGNGWTPDETGAYFRIVMNNAGGAALDDAGISSIAIFDELADFELSNHVIMSCLTSIDGSFDFEVAEATCHGNSSYNTDDMTGFEKTITGKALTPNYYILNPMAKKVGEVDSFDNVTVQKVVEDGVDYGFVTIADMAQSECRFISVALGDSCNITDAQMYRLSVPSRIDVDEKHYQLIDNGDGTTTFLMSKEHIGAPVIISYPKAVEAELVEFTEDVIGDTRVSMSYTKTQTDGVKYRYVYNNVLITSFPDALLRDETEFAFTLSIQKDSTGRFGRVYRILD